MSCDLLVFRWPLAFTSSDVTQQSRAILLSGIVGLVSGACIGVYTRSHARSLLTAALIVASLAAQISPWLYWLALDGRIAYRVALVALPCVCGCGLAILSIWVVQHATDIAAPNCLLRAIISAPWLAAAGAFFFVLATISTRTGVLVCGVVLGAAFLCLAASIPFETKAHEGNAKNSVVVSLCIGVLLVTVVNAVVANRCLPQAAVRASNHMVVHFQRGRIYDLRITSGQDAFHVFVGSRLRFSTLDQERWASALTRPALARLRCPKRALVFSLGEGLAERELLRQPCLEAITSVVRDRVAVDTARRQPWWRRTISDAWHSPRVRLIERDPAVWLQDSAPDSYDLVIVDLPDPDNYVDAKYFTRYFYREIGKRLSANAILLTQATSALRSPRTFASILTTLNDAGFHTLAYRAAMTTLGEWYFLMASPTAIPEELPQAQLQSATSMALESFVIPPDALPTLPGRVSRLDDPAAMDAFIEESGDETL